MHGSYHSRINNLVLENRTNPFLTALTEFKLLFWLVLDYSHALKHNKIPNRLVLDIAERHLARELNLSTYVHETALCDFINLYGNYAGFLHMLFNYIKHLHKTKEDITPILSYMKSLNADKNATREEITLITDLSAMISDWIVTKNTAGNSEIVEVKPVARVEGKTSQDILSEQLVITNQLNVSEDIKKVVHKALIDTFVESETKKINSIKNDLYKQYNIEFEINNINIKA